jgi:hypothetical protein
MFAKQVFMVKSGKNHLVVLLYLVTFIQLIMK